MKTKSHVVLSQEDYEKFKPMLIENNIPFNPCGYGKNVYIGFEVDEPTHNKIDELLEKL